MREWFYLVGLSLVWAVGDVLYKQATNVSGDLSAERLPQILVQGVSDVLVADFTPASKFVLLFVAAMTLAFGANLGYSIPLSRLPVSVAKPALNVLTLAFVAVFGVVAFGESLSARRTLGLVFVVAGVWLLAQSTT